VAVAEVAGVSGVAGSRTESKKESGREHCVGECDGEIQRRQSLNNSRGQRSRDERQEYRKSPSAKARVAQSGASSALGPPRIAGLADCH
jgi:hypothetical protein